jgi:putative DNA primase/helicase
MVPQALRDLPQWLVWRSEDHGEKKPRKVPYYVNGGRRVGEQGSENDRQQLTSFDAAQRAITEKQFTGVGFAFLPGDGLVGVDLDNVIDAQTGELSETARDIVARCASFTEYSPSGRGLHVFCRADTKALRSFKSNKIGVEVFCNAQYFTVTGRHYPGSPEDIGDLSAAALDHLRSLVDAAKGRHSERGATAPSLPLDDTAEIESALAYINADEYSEWITIGHAVKSKLGAAGLGVWDRWSSRSAKYPGSDQARRKWDSFEPKDVTIATVFDRALKAGWRAPARQRTNSIPGGDGNTGKPPSSNAGEGDTGPPKPQIRWIAGELPRVVSEAEDALIATDQGLYQRGPLLVRVVRRDAMSVRNFERPAGSLGIVVVDRAYLVERMTRSAEWLRYDSRAEDWRRINAPEQAAVTFLARQGQWKLPRLLAAISAPTLRPDGTVLQQPGYDKRTATWYDPCGMQFPPVPDKPDKRAAALALDVLLKAFSTFPFAQEHDRSVAVALALTALVRRSLPSAPLGAISAPVMGSGKTLLADCVAILSTGVAAPAMQYPDTDEEASKTALAVLAEGDAVVLIDNVERPLQGDWLCSVLTSETFRARMLGRTEMMSVPTSTLFLATGNQLVIQGDLRTRALLCCIDPKIEKPEQREFKHDLREWITTHRTKLVVAGLTLMRAFICSGQSASEFVRPWGRFERWSEMVRAPLVWMGCADPCASLDALEADDPQRIEHLQIMAGWQREFGAGAQTARQAIDHAIQVVDKTFSEALSQVAADRGGGLSSRRLARWLTRFSGRIVGGRQFVKAGERDHVAMWKVNLLQ